MINKKFSKVALLSAALFGLGFATVTANSDSANAKSYAKVKSNKAYTTNYTERNYLPSGSAALYSKAGTLKGARKVASTTTLKSLAQQSDKGQSYFRAYRIAKTNRGSYYLKVVSFDKTYRGWIYAGKSNPSGKTSVGGMKKVSTFNQGNLTTDISNATYYFGSSSTTYKQPDWTEYKIGRNMASLSGDYTKDPLRVTGVGTKTNGRDNNATYYFVEDSAHPTVNGWIKASDLKAGSSTGASSSSSVNIGANQVLVNYIDSSTGNSVTTKLLTNNNASTQTAASFLGSNLSGQAYSNIPSGYSAPSDSSDYGTKNTSALASAAYGKQVDYYVVASSTQNLFSTAPKYTTFANNKSYSGLPGDPVSKNAFTSPTGVQFSTLLSNLAKETYTSGNNGQHDTFTSTDIWNAVSDSKMDEIYYLAYCDPMSNFFDGSKQAVLTASSTGTPSVSGLFGTSSSSSTSDTSSQLSDILSAAGVDPLGSALSGLGSLIGSGLDGIANSLFGGRICYRVVKLTTSQAQIKTANGDSVKMGTQVTIPYTANASKVVTESAIKGANNNLKSLYDGNVADATANATEQGYAFNDKSFQSSTSALSGLLTDGTSTSGSSTSTSSTSTSTSSLSSLLSALSGSN